MEATTITPIRIVESELANAVRVEVTPQGGHRPLIFRVVLASRTLDWIVRDPYGATLCRADTRERGVEVALGFATRMLKLASDMEHMA